VQFGKTKALKENTKNPILSTSFSEFFSGVFIRNGKKI